jgi:hypothetical protein
MPPLQLIALAVVAMVGLAILRLVRVRLGRTPLPEVGRRIFLLAFVVVPPIALGVLTTPAGAAGQLPWLAYLPIYVAIVAAFALVMWMVALIVGQLTHGRWGNLIRLALSGSADDPDDVRIDPRVTTRLAESIVGVGKANKVFPRGREFPSQIARAGFRDDWDLLDRATETLESRIADDIGHGLAVASAATATAKDARSRLDTLRGLSVDTGAAWAAS